MVNEIVSERDGAPGALRFFPAARSTIVRTPTFCSRIPIRNSLPAAPSIVPRRARALRPRRYTHTLIADRLGLVPEIPDELVARRRASASPSARELMEYAAKEPAALKGYALRPGKNARGARVGQASNLAALMGDAHDRAEVLSRERRSRGLPTRNGTSAYRVFQALLDSPSGTWWPGRSLRQHIQYKKKKYKKYKEIKIKKKKKKKKEKKNKKTKKTTDAGKIEIFIPEMEERCTHSSPASEEAKLALPKEFPLILTHGRHYDYNANSLMRDPNGTGASARGRSRRAPTP